MADPRWNAPELADWKPSVEDQLWRANKPQVAIAVQHLFNGRPSLSGEMRMRMLFSPHRLRVEVDAPFHDDPRPPGPPGSADGLWNFEVAELFLLGSRDRYLEIELGPHGHFLVLQLQGARNVLRGGLPCEYHCKVDGERWSGRAEVESRWLPPDLEKMNAYAIHGSGASREYRAWRPCPGTEPDFHQLDCFGLLRPAEEPPGGAPPRSPSGA